MKFYFSSNQIEALNEFNLHERQQIIEIAGNKIKPTQKFVLNLIKLAILIPPFMMLAKVDSWMFVLPLVFVMVGYFIVLRPFSLYFANQYIDKAIRDFKRQQDDE